MKANQPYVKKYVNGILANPIAKESPYLHLYNKEDKKKQRLGNNKKGIRLVVVRSGNYSFSKYGFRSQRIGKKTITHNVEF